MTNVMMFYKELEKYGIIVQSQFALNIPLVLLREIVNKFNEAEKNNESQGSHNSTNNCDTISQTQISTELKNICKEVILNEPEDATERERGYTIAFKHILQVIENKESRISKREKALDFLTSQAQKMGLYDTDF